MQHQVTAVEVISPREYLMATAQVPDSAEEAHDGRLMAGHQAARGRHARVAITLDRGPLLVDLVPGEAVLDEDVAVGQLDPGQVARDVRRVEGSGQPRA